MTDGYKIIDIKLHAHVIEADGFYNFNEGNILCFYKSRGETNFNRDPVSYWSVYNIISITPHDISEVITEARPRNRRHNRNYNDDRHPWRKYV